MEDLLHHQEEEGEDEASSLSFPSSQAKTQHRLLGRQFLKTRNEASNNLSSSSSYSPSQHRRQEHPQEQDQVMIDPHEENQYHSPPSRSRMFSHPATSQVPLAVRRRRDSLDEGIQREREKNGKDGTRSQGEMDLKGSSDGDGWGFAGGGGELREQRDGGDDYGWEMI